MFSAITQGHLLELVKSYADLSNEAFYGNIILPLSISNAGPAMV